MSLSINTTKHSLPPRGLIHGGEGVGKSTFASGFPEPLFLPTEDGLRGLDTNVLTFDSPEGGKKQKLDTFDEYMQAATYCLENPDGYQTLITDSADWLEMLVHKHICQSYSVSNIAEAAGGYGKGYLESKNMMLQVLQLMDAINAKGKSIIFLCHSKPTVFNDPLSEPYDKWIMKLHTNKNESGTQEIFKEWADFIGFAEAEKFTRKTVADDSKNRSVVSGKRFLHLEETAGFVAKNRYGIKGKVDLNYEAFIGAFQQS